MVKPSILLTTPLLIPLWFWMVVLITISSCSMSGDPTNGFLCFPTNCFVCFGCTDWIYGHQLQWETRSTCIFRNYKADKWKMWLDVAGCCWWTNPCMTQKSQWSTEVFSQQTSKFLRISQHIQHLTCMFKFVYVYSNGLEFCPNQNDWHQAMTLFCHAKLQTLGYVINRHWAATVGQDLGAQFGQTQCPVLA